MPGIQNHLVGGAQATPLHVDFNPVKRGNFQGNSVTLAAPTDPIRRHAPPMTFREKLQSFASKVRNFFGGESSQNSYRFRWGLRQVAREATAFANEILSRQGQNTPIKASLQGHCDRLLHSLGTCTAYGAEGIPVLKARFDVMLKNMDATQIAALENTLGDVLTDQTYQHPQMNLVLSILGEAIHSHRSSILANLHPYVADAFNQLLAEPTNQNLNTLIHECRSYGHHTGLGSDTDTAYALFTAVIGKRIGDINDEIADSNGNPEVLKAMDPFKADIPNLLSDECLQRIFNFSHPFLTGDECTNGQFYITGRFGLRVDELHASIDRGVERWELKLEGQDPEPDKSILDIIESLINDIDKIQYLERSCESLKEFDTQTCFNRLTALALLHRESFSAKLFDLAPKEVMALKEIAKNQGLDEIHAIIDLHLVDRKEILAEKFGSSFEKMLNAITGSNPLELLRSARSHILNGDKIIEALQTFGEKIDDPNSVFDFRAKMADKYFSANLSTEDKIQLLRKFDQAENINFIYNLINLSFTAGAQGINAPFNPRGLQSEIFDDTSNILKIREQILASIPEELHTPEPNYDPDNLKLSDLSEKQIEAIKEHYGIVVADDQPISVVKSAAERALEHTFRYDQTVTPRTSMHIFVDNEDQSLSLTPVSPDSAPLLTVDTTFWVDLPRANYQLQDSEGNITPLLDRSTIEDVSDPKDHTKIAEAALKLQEFIGDHQFTYFVTQNIHEGLLAPVQNILTTPSSPIGNNVLGHGYMSGQQSTSYSFEKNQDGSLTVHVEHSVKNADHLIAIPRDFEQPAVAVPIDSESSFMKFNFSIKLSPDRQITISSAPKFDFHIAQ